jgi:glyoxylase-like metal-dependent hydrolase (beta-lactamase superfamily II)
MSEQPMIDQEARADGSQEGSVHSLGPDLAYQRLAIVNVVFFGAPGAGDRQWALIDAGLPMTANTIADAAAQRFGEGSRPAAIILTHGHADHVGALKTLAERWDAPIYAHRLEQPYLDGRSAYPPPDTSVGGGLMTAMSRFFSPKPIDVKQWLRELPEDGSVPGMDGWRWLATPGHTPGHISLWRDADRTLVVGDAFITTKQESAFAVALQLPVIHGPPMYYTPDWAQARASVERLAALEPELVISGHGPAMQGPSMREALHALARNFDEVAVPKHGRYVGQPARADESGVTYVPPKE